MADETFFTVIGCMDGRCVEPVKEYGRKEFGAEYADTITEPGIVGILSSNPTQVFLDNLTSKILISLQKHKSRGILIDGHAECAGDPVEDNIQKDQIRKSVSLITNLINNQVPVLGVFIRRRHPDVKEWEVDELPLTMVA